MFSEEEAQRLDELAAREYDEYQTAPLLDWNDVSGRGDPEQRYRIYRLCPGETEPDLVATCASEAAVGVALCTLGREGEFDPDAGDCAVGVLDTAGEVGRKWIFRPWLASPGNVSAAGKVLRTARADVQASRPK